MFFKKASISIEGCEQAKVTYNQTSRCFSLTSFQSPPILGTDNYSIPCPKPQNSTSAAKGGKCPLPGMGKGPHSDLEGSRAIN